MRPNEIAKEVDKLSLSDKILLVEDIWDKIALKNHTLPLPEWQKKELDTRYREYKEGKMRLYDWESVHEDLRKQE